MSTSVSALRSIFDTIMKRKKEGNWIFKIKSFYPSTLTNLCFKNFFFSRCGNIEKKLTRTWNQMQLFLSFFHYPRQIFSFSCTFPFVSFNMKWKKVYLRIQVFLSRHLNLEVYLQNLSFVFPSFGFFCVAFCKYSFSSSSIARSI